MCIRDRCKEAAQKYRKKKRLVYKCCQIEFPKSHLPSYNSRFTTVLVLIYFLKKKIKLPERRFPCLEDGWSSTKLTAKSLFNIVQPLMRTMADLDDRIFKGVPNKKWILCYADEFLSKPKEKKILADHKNLTIMYYESLLRLHLKQKEALLLSPIVKGLEIKNYKDYDRVFSYINSVKGVMKSCLLYTSPSPRDLSTSRMPSSA